MASAPPAETLEPITTERPPEHRPARIVVLCGLLALIAILVGLLIGSRRHDPPLVAPTAIAGSAVVATSPPGAPTPTPLANIPTATPAPAPTTTVTPPTVTAPTNPPPVVAAPAVQPVPAVRAAPVQSAPIVPHDDGKNNGNGKDKGKGKGKG